MYCFSFFTGNISQCCVANAIVESSMRRDYQLYKYVHILRKLSTLSAVQLLVIFAISTLLNAI